MGVDGMLLPQAVNNDLNIVVDKSLLVTEEVNTAGLHALINRVSVTVGLNHMLDPTFSLVRRDDQVGVFKFTQFADGYFFSTDNGGKEGLDAFHVQSLARG